MDDPIGDPYRACESGRCNHDLARAVSLAELWGSDGPFPPGYLVVNLSAHRSQGFADDEAPALQQRWAV